ncbi:hypothetical protein EAH86_10040 [Pedococcus bigeumensis]|uniref:Uncharacterized protein n=1 Tax=Pedococcus bigeumensis TaxID=433644 RepID=A0A502CWR2_9MICO|nr:hypothetical protein EAH86_10040 [Pedococcus bigeumensis]
MVSTPPVPPADKGAPEHDPTGIRDLLASLPDPGPMPADLVARINASIAAEQSAREDAVVVPLRPRRWGWQHVGVAAAAAAVLGIGLPALLTGTGPGDLLASFGGSQSADSASGASVESRTDTSSVPGAAAGEAPRTPTTTAGGQRVRSSPGAVALEASGTAYTAAALATQAGSKLTTAQDGAVAAPKARRGAAETPNGLRACLSAIGVEAWMPVRGDLATLDGAPAVIALVSSDTGQTVYAVAPTCDAVHPGVLAGPVRVR